MNCELKHCRFLDIHYYPINLLNSFSSVGDRLSWIIHVENNFIFTLLFCLLSYFLFVFLPLLHWVGLLSNRYDNQDLSLASDLNENTFKILLVCVKFRYIFGVGILCQIKKLLFYS